MAQHSAEVGEEGKSEFVDTSVGLMLNGSQGRGQRGSGAQEEKSEAAVDEHQEEEHEDEEEEKEEKDERNGTVMMIMMMMMMMICVVAHGLVWSLLRCSMYPI